MTSHSAHLAQPFDHVCNPIAEIVQNMGYSAERDGTRMTVTLPLGQVVFQAREDGTEAEFSSPTGPQLQMLKDLYAQRFARLGLDEGIRWIVPEGQTPLNQTACTVQSVTRISPNFVRMRLTGGFGNFARPDAGLHFRFMMGPEGAHWPVLDDNGLTQWPGGVEAWHRPVYTVRQISPDADWMDVDIVLHDGGRVTDWCPRLVPGESIAITGPAGSKLPTARRLVLLGDETAMPVILRIVESMPAETEIRCVLALRSPDDIQPTQTKARVITHICDMTDPNALLDALDEHLTLTPDTHLFFAAEKAQAAEARARIKAAGLAPQQARAAGYWTRET